MRTFLLVLPLALVACSPVPAAGPPASEPAAPAPIASASAPRPASAPRWGYDGDVGPARWGSLGHAFAACAEGRAQSPIDLSSAAPSDPAFALSLPTPATQPLRVVHTGHTIQVDAAAQSSVTFEGMRYDLAQLHFHSPAEHTVDGARFDAEMHLVHRSAAGKLLVVGVLLRKGAENAALKALWEAMPASPTPAPVVIVGQGVDVGALVPKSGRYASYQGSLTAPPCSEGVTWLVALPEASAATSVPEVSEAQLARLHAAIGAASNRPTQPANGRVTHVVVAAPR